MDQRNCHHDVVLHGNKRLDSTYSQQLFMSLHTQLLGYVHVLPPIYKLKNEQTRPLTTNHMTTTTCLKNTAKG